MQFVIVFGRTAQDMLIAPLHVLERAGNRNLRPSSEAAGILGLFSRRVVPKLSTPTVDVQACSSVGVCGDPRAVPIPIALRGEGFFLARRSRAPFTPAFLFVRVSLSRTARRNFDGVTL